MPSSKTGLARSWPLECAAGLAKACLAASVYPACRQGEGGESSAKDASGGNPPKDTAIFMRRY